MYEPSIPDDGPNTTYMYSKTECQTGCVCAYPKLAAYLNLEQVMHTIMYSLFDRENVIHADLKPENILLEEGTLKKS